MNYSFSENMGSLQPSLIREMLKATASPDVIPFAAGNPASEAFPVEEVRRIAGEILQENPETALQYGVSEGYEPLRKAISDLISRRENISGENNSVLVTSGATQVMDLTARVLCNNGDTVICENPSFIGSLNCFRSHGCKLCGVDMEEDGMNMQELEKALKTTDNVKFIYTIPNFQNPTGYTMSLQKRKRLYELALEHNVMILEDNPYGELRVSGSSIPSIKSMDSRGIVIYAGSFSKILAPGIRVGYAAAPKEIIAKMTVGKQTEDVHNPCLNQMIVNKWLTEYDIDGHIEKIRDIYRRKLNLMCDCIDRELGDFVKYKKADGGLFVWCAVDGKVSVNEFAQKALERNVAVVPGSAFLVDEMSDTRYIRLNFSTPSDDAIVKGIKILGEIAGEYRR